MPLTPSYFLHGQIGGAFAPESVDKEDNQRNIGEEVKNWNDSSGKNGYNSSYFLISRT